MYRGGLAARKGTAAPTEDGQVLFFEVSIVGGMLAPRSLGRERSVRVDAVYLFGSIARRVYTAESDVDLVIVSRDWGRYSMEERLSMLYRLWRWERDAALIPLTSEELRDRLEKSMVLRDASRYWMRIA